MDRKTLLDSRGFTLMELMVTIAIISLLMAIAIPNYINYRNKGFCTQAEEDAIKVYGAIADYYSLPGNTALATPAELDVTTRNPYDITGDPNAVISIIVTDRTGRCPDAYQLANTMWVDDPAQDVLIKKIQ